MITVGALRPAGRDFAGVGPAVGGVVAAGAGDAVVARQPGIEEQLFAQRRLGRRIGIVGRERHCRQQAQIAETVAGGGVQRRRRPIRLRGLAGAVAQVALAPVGQRGGVGRRVVAVRHRRLGRAFADGQQGCGAGVGVLAVRAQDARLAGIVPHPDRLRRRGGGEDRAECGVAR
ncbi:hypothetical protein ABD440_22320 [Chromobacterium piscinae]